MAVEAAAFGAVTAADATEVGKDLIADRSTETTAGVFGLRHGVLLSKRSQISSAAASALRPAMADKDLKSQSKTVSANAIKAECDGARC